MYNKYRSLNPKILAIGGGTGLSTLLKGIKNYSSDITAIVTMADDGGGSGVLRRSFGMLPPGDVRNCLLALSDIEPEMNTLLSHRFEKGELKGQSFGNLFLLAMNEIYGSFEEAVKMASSILRVKGTVMPITVNDVNIEATYDDKSKAFGESILPAEAIKDNKKIKRVELCPKDVEPLDGVITAINKADIILIGPGSLYTSIIPNLLVKGVTEAIISSPAKKIYVQNVMTQHGETDDMSVKDHVEAIFEHSDKIFDSIIINNKVLSEDLKKKYQEEYQEQIFLTDGDKKYLEEEAIDYIEGDCLDGGDYARHDSEKLSNMIIDYYIRTRRVKTYEK
ncbi:MAG: uridine diphosphate-N-acetylglucosamine-binding protein YvcK [Eubacteriales bacterium]|uniref:gluconeogenesis factor YvcK family protein n=1 Tax=Fenollaria sp. TaxID=1965292 RepID=UPI002A74D7AC|nr:uridine diphosphate-N-acetylglucosamine-binding protein YvcK [Fenollaria sp.]MDD7339528.1 uridine diphosphate-N-acetylglucosamine-binding protein YvcK [Eubacteriales bacterium]MDY3105361.1 uridine diphosphate-N-acetylglucosamine-binding protein YvcK [Fenollaria sp.]